MQPYLTIPLISNPIRLWYVDARDEQTTSTLRHRGLNETVSILVLSSFPFSLAFGAGRDWSGGRLRMISLFAVPHAPIAIAPVFRETYLCSIPPDLHVLDRRTPFLAPSRRLVPRREDHRIRACRGRSACTVLSSPGGRSRWRVVAEQAATCPVGVLLSAERGQFDSFIHVHSVPRLARSSLLTLTFSAVRFRAAVLQTTVSYSPQFTLKFIPSPGCEANVTSVIETRSAT